VIIDEPTEPGLAGLFLRSGPIARIVAQTAMDWAELETPETVEALPGAWLLPLPEERRRHRYGFTIAFALSKAALQSKPFQDVCDEANIDHHAARKSLADIATYAPESCNSISHLLKWSQKDLVARRQSEQTIDGFTRQLTDSYETIDLLYTLGRSMHDISHPEKFVSLVCNRIHLTMGFGWIAALFIPDTRLGRRMSKRLHVCGQAPGHEEAIARAAQDLLSRVPDVNGAFIASEAAGLDLEPGAQLLVQPIAREGQIGGVLIVGDKRGDDPHVSSYDMQLIETAAGYVAAFLENAALYSDQQAMFMGSLRALTAAIDAKDRYTHGHSERVALLGARLAEASGVDAGVVKRIHICGLVHDVGKIGVPETVLCKTGKLTDAEFEMVKQHPEIGRRIVSQIPLLEDVLPGVLHHHERWDGKGYPHGLAGEGIPLFGRLLALADTFDAMSSTRSYRGAMKREDVLSEIRRCAASQFDPKLAEIFVGLDFGEYDKLVQHHHNMLGKAPLFGTAARASRDAA
jgi:HD-GYP domain-containing protein (c-di-GMP phosphodiesterase class II)